MLVAAAYQQATDPVGGSVGLSAIFAALPLIVLFVLLGGVRMKAQWAALISLAVAIVVAIAFYGMPVGQTVLAASEGAVFGLFPILWIVVNAIWLYNLTVKTGHFAVLRRSFGSISDDQRVQAIIVAFAFGALIEGLAGFGAPVAISAVMLLGLGFQPIKAAVLALIGNTAPVAFGSIATPIITLAEITGLDKDQLGAMAGRQTPLLALFVPLILVYVVDGRRGVRQTWPAAIVAGVAFAIAQFVTSNYISVELTDIVGALVATAALVAFLRVWSPSDPLVLEGGSGQPAVAGASAHDSTMEGDIRRRDQEHDSRKDVYEAYAPYIIIVAVFVLAKLITPIADALAAATIEFPWPGLDVVTAKGEAPPSATFKFNWLEAPGTIVLICGIITMLVLRVGVGRAIQTYGETLSQLKWAIVTVTAVLALAYVMNTSAMTQTLGAAAAATGGFFVFLSPIVGWLGVAVTGSDTSSNALFGTLQITAAEGIGVSQTLLAAANSSGGVLGKMLSPQNLAIGAAAVGLAGQEGDIFRKVLGWSLVMTLIMCILVVLQASVLSFMITGP